MKKKLLLVAMLAAAGSAHGQATNVRLFGTVDAYVGELQYSGQKKVTVVNSGGMTTSFFGLEGSEDLGGGLKADFHISGFFRGDTGASGRFDSPAPGVAGDAFFSRGAWVGIGSPYGSVKLGRQGTATFITMLRTSAFADSSVFNPAFVHTWVGGQPMATPLSSAADNIWSNMVSYTSPNFAGSSVMLQYALGENAKTADGGNARYAASYFFANKDINASVSYEKVASALIAAGPAAQNSFATLQVAGSYDFGVLKLSAGHLRTKQDLATAADKTFKTSHIGANIPAGPGSVLIQLGQTKIQQAGVADLKRTTITAGYDYMLSKRTDLYFVYMNDKITALNTGNTAVIGIRHRF